VCGAGTSCSARTGSSAGVCSGVAGETIGTAGLAVAAEASRSFRLPVRRFCVPVDGDNVFVPGAEGCFAVGWSVFAVVGTVGTAPFAGAKVLAVFDADGLTPVVACTALDALSAVVGPTARTTASDDRLADVSLTDFEAPFMGTFGEGVEGLAGFAAAVK